MPEYKGKINVSKDTMLHVVNEIYNKKVKESTTKENILKMMQDIYTEENLMDLIKMLPYEAYKDLKKIFKNQNDINSYEKMEKYENTKYLEETMIIFSRLKKLELTYYFNEGVLEKIEKIFDYKNEKIAKKYAEIEEITIGMLYTYGVVDFKYLRESICTYMSEIITEEELKDLYFKRLNLNMLINYYNIKWEDTKEVEEYVTYLYEEEIQIEIGELVIERLKRNIGYKKIKKEEIIKRKELFWDENAQRLYDYVVLHSEFKRYYRLKSIMKETEFGKNIINKITQLIRFKDESEMNEFMEIYMKWHNNSPQYILGGYTPIEVTKKYMR